MKITIKGQKRPREVNDAKAKVLIARGLAVETRHVEPEPAELADESTTRPKRQYRRRDMKAED